MRHRRREGREGDPATLDLMRSTAGQAETVRRALRKLLAALAVVAVVVLATPDPALAHAELRQASPDRGETVGGAIHSITMQFFDLDLSKPQIVEVFDGAGNRLPAQLNNEGQRLVLALVDPITTPGEYVVTFQVSGVDGDFTQESFSFFWEEGAPEPKGITVDLTSPVGFDTLNYVLILAGAALAAFLVHRFMMAYREHRAASSIPDASIPDEPQSREHP